MAFGQGRVSSENTGSFKRYFGLASVKVLAVNPTMKEWNEITGGNMQNEPEYTSEKDGVKTARITLLTQSIKDLANGSPAPIIPITFWFRKAPVVGSQSGKIQIIDKYGRTAWATEEEVKEKRIPQYTNGPANIDKDYRKIVNGEESFTEFLKAYLGIPPLTFKDKNGNIVTNPNPSDCECRLDHILKIFDGDFKEIKSVFALMPNNYCKVLFGIRTVEDREYQDFYPGMFLSCRNNQHIRIANKLREDKALGRYANHYFGEESSNGVIIIDLQEKVVTPTTFVDTPTEAPSTEEDKDTFPF